MKSPHKHAELIKAWADGAAEALAQPEQEPKRVGTIGHIGAGKTTLVAAIAQMLVEQPAQTTGWDNGLSQDYDKKLGAWFSEKPNAKQELREALTPPKPKEWVGLTGDDISLICIDKVDAMLMTEAKLKELNT